jgi:excisionase family DNA binding protein
MGEWLSLHEAAEILGVHPGTVRNWADQGYLPVRRTKGGHRRFRRADIELWRQSQESDGGIEPGMVGQNMLRHTRMQIGEGRLENEGWYQKLDEDARQQYRQSGHSLVQGLIGHLSSPDENGMQAEARSLGYEYASRGRRYGLSSAEATHAFLFFRNMLMEEMFNLFETAGIRSSRAWGNMFRKVTDFTDHIMITLLETYDAYQRGGR